MSIGGVSGAASYSAAAFFPPASTPTASAPPAAATSAEDFLSSLAGGTGASASAGSQSSAQSMLEAIQDPTRYESAGYYNQMAMLNAFGTGSSDSSGSSGSDDDSNQFDLLSRIALPQDVQAKYSQLAAQYGNGTSGAGINYLT